MFRFTNEWSNLGLKILTTMAVELKPCFSARCALRQLVVRTDRTVSFLVVCPDYSDGNGTIAEGDGIVHEATSLEVPQMRYPWRVSYCRAQAALGVVRCFGIQYPLLKAQARRLIRY